METSLRTGRIRWRPHFRCRDHAGSVAAAARRAAEMPCSAPAFFRKAEWTRDRLRRAKQRREGGLLLRAIAASHPTAPSRHMVELQPDAVGILEQQRVISRRPLVLARRADDVAERPEACSSSTSARSRARKQRWCRPTRFCSKAAPVMLGRRRADRDPVRPPTRNNVSLSITGFSRETAAVSIESRERSKFDAVRKTCAMPLTSIVSPFVGTTISDRLCRRSQQHTGIDPIQNQVMQPVAQTRARGAGLAVAVSCVLVAAAWPADAAGCAFEPQGEGRVAAVIDARTLSAAGRPRGPPRRHRADRQHQSQPALRRCPR